MIFLWAHIIFKRLCQAIWIVARSLCSRISSRVFPFDLMCLCNCVMWLPRIFTNNIWLIFLFTFFYINLDAFEVCVKCACEPSHGHPSSYLLTFKPNRPDAENYFFVFWCVRKHLKLCSPILHETFEYCCFLYVCVWWFFWLPFLESDFFWNAIFISLETSDTDNSRNFLLHKAQECYTFSFPFLSSTTWFQKKNELQHILRVRSIARFQL